MNENKKVLLAFLAVSFFWGSTYLAIRIGVEDLPPFLFAGLRFLIAGSLMLAYAKWKGHAFPTEIKDVTKVSIVGLLMLLGGNGLVVYAEQWVHSGIASLLVSTVPLTIAVIEIFILRQKKMHYTGFIGLLIGFGGVAYLALGDSSGTVIDLLGTVLLLIASTSWSIGSVFSKTFETKSAITTNIGIQMLAGGLGLTLVGLVLGELSRFQFTPNSFWSLVYLIFFGSLIGYSCYIYVLAKWPASKAGTYAYINPVVAVLLGAAILNEPFTPAVILSMVIIIGGVFLVQRAKIENI